ncbi:glycosyltransferase family 39 protein [Candidatus Micrarchaeota archaeon]|nr:glycosyltransferase family 39 protein [Candidatus Micrarchaeota archaeon]
MDDRKLLLAVALLAAVSLGLSLLFFNKVLDGGDEGQILESGKLISEGKVVYKDVANLYSPGVFFLAAVLNSLFPSDYEIAARLAIALISVAAVAVLFLISTRLMPSPYVFIPPCLLLVWGIPFQHIISPTWPALLFQLVAVYLAVRGIEKPGGRNLLFQGVAVGAVAFFKQNMGLYTLLGIAVFHLIDAAHDAKISGKGRETRAFLEGLYKRKPFVLGVMAIPAITIAYFALNSALPDLYSSVLLRADSAHLDNCWNMPFPTLASIVPRGISLEELYRSSINSAYYAVLFLYAAAFLYAVRKRTAFGDVENKALLVIALVALFQFHMVVFPRTDRNHLLFSIPLAYVLAAFFSAKLSKRAHESRKPRDRLAGSLPLAYIALFALLGLALISYAYMPYLRGTGMTARNGLVFPATQETVDFLNSADYVNNRTAPDEKVFVAGSFATFYTLSQRYPAARYVQLFPGMTSPLEVQEEIINSVRNSRVRYAVISANDKIDRCSFADYDGRILTYLNSSFELEARFGNFTVLRKK